MVNFKTKFRFKKLIASVLSVCLILTALFVLPIAPEVKAEIDVWDPNEQASKFTAGDGSKESPWLISTPEQLYLLVSKSSTETAGKYAALTNDIYLNDVTKENWVEIANNWFAGYNSTKFSFRFDGRGFTIYGLVNDGTVGSHSGLFAAIGNGAEVKNVVISDAYVVGSSTAGAIAGRAYGSAAGEAACVISNVTITDSVVINGASAGGIIGANAMYNEAAAALTISDCLVITKDGNITGTNAGGIIGNTYRYLNVNNCVSIGKDAFSKTDSKTTATNVYTNKDTTAATKVTEAQLTGEAAKATLSGFNFVTMWNTTDTYPTLRHIKPEKAKSGDVWSGFSALHYAGGDGTWTNPYQIATGEQLYKMISENYLAEASAPRKYFVLTSDIYLNNVSDVNWISNTPNHWFNSTATSYVFKGVLDGKGHTINGLYLTSNTYNGLIPQLGEGAEIKNLQIKNSNISGSYAGAIAGRAYGTTGTTPAKITNCTIDSSVVISSANAGGLVGGNASNAVASALTISDCLVISTGTITGTTYGGGLVGNSWKPVNVTNSLSIGIDAFGRSTHSSTVLSGVYTNQTTVSVAAVQTVIDAEITGETAKTTLSSFDFNTIWETTASYPVLSHANPDAAKPGDKWTGLASTKALDGEGTKENPYKISTGEELRYMFENYVENEDNSSVYFELTNDIDLNNKIWNVNKGQAAYFSSTLDGNGHTISNLNAIGTTYSGLLHQLGNGAVVKNIVFDSPNVTASANHAGVIAARVISNAVISNCIIKDAAISATTNAGGFIGVIAGSSSASATLKIDNCGFSGNINTATNQGGIVATIQNYSFVEATTCYVVGYDAFSSNIKTASIPKCDYVYTTVTEPITASGNGATTLSEDKMKGAAAADNLKGFNFKNIWATTENSYPVLRFFNPDSVNAGEIWSGLSATKYAGGDGTEESPYQIATGEQLYKMVTENCVNGDEGEYYVLTSDIYLNDISVLGWQQKNPNSWHSVSAAAYSFNGSFDGQGHTVYGLYGNFNSDSVQVRSALIPIIGAGSTVKNVHVSDANLSGSGTQAVFLAAITAYVATFDEGITVIDGCSAKNTFIESSRAGGGIVCGVPKATVKVSNSFFDGTVVKGTSDSAQDVGGIVGSIWADGTALTIENCYAVGLPLVGNNQLATEDYIGYDNVESFANEELTAISGLIAKENTNWNFEEVWYVGSSELPLLRSRGERIFDTSGNDTFDEDDVAALRIMIINGENDVLGNVNNDSITDICDLVKINIMVNELPADSEQESALPNVIGSEYKLAWQQEFDSNSLNSNVWQLTGDMNERSDLKYSTSSDVLNVADGSLNMNAVYDEEAGVYTTVAGLSTKNSMSFKYGYVEMKATVPYELGCWPSLWMKSMDAIGANNTDYFAEVDIFEVFGVDSWRKYYLTPNIHKWYLNANGSSTGIHVEIDSDAYKSVRFSKPNEEHIYGFLWTANEMKFYFDGACYATFTLDNFDAEGKTTDMSGFSQPMYLILNNMVYTEELIAEKDLDVGNITDGVENRANFSIDYIRIYQCDGSALNVR